MPGILPEGATHEFTVWVKGVEYQPGGRCAVKYTVRAMSVEGAIAKVRRYLDLELIKYEAFDGSLT